MMEYKGYTGIVTALDEKQGLIHGRVANVTDVVTFEGKTPEELIQAFHDSVDDYLEFCREEGEEPEKPCSGKFVVRIESDLHARAVQTARQAGVSLNTLVAGAINDFLNPSRPPALQVDPEVLQAIQVLEQRGLLKANRATQGQVGSGGQRKAQPASRSKRPAGVATGE